MLASLKNTPHFMWFFYACNLSKHTTVRRINIYSLAVLL